MDVREFNRRAWDRQVSLGNRWTVPVGPDVIAAARAGEWEVILTPCRPGESIASGDSWCRFSSPVKQP